MIRVGGGGGSTYAYTNIVSLKWTFHCFIDAVDLTLQNRSETLL